MMVSPPAIAPLPRANSRGRALSYLYSDRGFLLMHKGAIDAALTDLNKAAEIDPTNFYAYWNRGAVYAVKGDDLSARANLHARRLLSIRIRHRRRGLRRR